MVVSEAVEIISIKVVMQSVEEGDDFKVCVNHIVAFKFYFSFVGIKVKLEWERYLIRLIASCFCLLFFFLFCFISYRICCVGNILQ